MQRNLLTLARAFLARGLEVEVYAVDVRGPTRQALPPRVHIERLRPGLAPGSALGLPPLAEAGTGVRPPATALLRAPSVLRAVPALAEVLRRRMPDALLALGTQCNLAALLARRRSGHRLQLVVSEHNPLSAVVAHARNPFRRLYPELIRRSYPEAEGVVAVSEAVRRDLIELAGLPAGRIRLVSNPMDLEEIERRSGEPLSHPIAAGDGPLILGVGRLHWQKGFRLLIAGFALLRARRPCRLVILGDGPERGRLERAVRRLGLEGAVALPGHEPNPWRWMRRAALFVQCSQSEGFGHALVEALACGTSVVALACPGATSEILACGRFGRVVRERSPAALAAAMASALERPLPSRLLVARAREVAGSRAVDAYLELLTGGLHVRA